MQTYILMAPVPCRGQLDSLKIKYEYPIAKTGIVARLGTGKPPVVALRTDMDGLPIQVNSRQKEQFPISMGLPERKLKVWA